MQSCSLEFRVLVNTVVSFAFGRGFVSECSGMGNLCIHRSIGDKAVAVTVIVVCARQGNLLILID